MICRMFRRTVTGNTSHRKCSRRCRRPSHRRSRVFFVGASIGLQLTRTGGNEPQKLLKVADIAMYAAKGGGAIDTVTTIPSMDALAIEELKLENNLPSRTSRREFHLAFQPIVDLSSDGALAVEALLRWTNAEMGDPARQVHTDCRKRPG